MPDRRDDLDSWLDGRVDPLPPPPGTFELIKRRARRRKYRRLAVTAGAAAVIVAAAVTVPQVVNLPVLNPTTAHGAAANGRSATPTPSASGGAHHRVVIGRAGAVSPRRRRRCRPTFGPPRSRSSARSTGWVIGQAGTPGHCATQYCTSVARTDDAGKTWTGVPAPLTGPADGATGVSQIRFLNGEDGWAFGPELFATHDGGHTWAQVVTDGLRVTDLETVGDRAFAVFASCTGTGAAFAAQCTSFTLYSSPAAADDWTPVGPATSRADRASGGLRIVLTGTRGYLLAPNGMLYSGPVNGSAPWPPVASVPCAVGTPQADGQPTGALLGAANATNLILVCASSSVPGAQQASWSSPRPTAGSAWQNAGAAPGRAWPPRWPPARRCVVLATDQGIDVLPAGSATWQEATLDAAVPAGGFATWA